MTFKNVMRQMNVSRNLGFSLERAGHAGFTLVELSIVLVILGLLTGGILSGQSLIRAAELRSVGTEFQRYRTAVHSFRDKYFALPGDMSNATSFWTSLGGTGSDVTCQNTAATGAPTCNGNGNNQVFTSVVNNDEQLRFWQHLANAGLIEGSYTGVVGAAYVPGGNVGPSKLANSYWWTGTSTGTGAPALLFQLPAGGYFNIGNTGAVITTAGSFTLMPEEAWNIDTKLDDGKPGTGTVMSNKGNGTNTNCNSAAGIGPPGDVGATYSLTNSNKDCSLYSVRAF